MRHDLTSAGKLGAAGSGSAGTPRMGTTLHKGNDMENVATSQLGAKSAIDRPAPIGILDRDHLAALINQLTLGHLYLDTIQRDIVAFDGERSEIVQHAIDKHQRDGAEPQVHMPILYDNSQALHYAGQLAYELQARLNRVVNAIV